MKMTQTNRFRKEIMFREAIKADNAYVAGIEKIYGSEDAEILMMDTRSLAALSGVVKQAADAYLASM